MRSTRAIWPIFNRSPTKSVRVDSARSGWRPMTRSSQLRRSERRERKFAGRSAGRTRSCLSISSSGNFRLFVRMNFFLESGWKLSRTFKPHQMSLGAIYDPFESFSVRWARMAVIRCLWPERSCLPGFDGRFYWNFVINKTLLMLNCRTLVNSVDSATESWTNKRCCQISCLSKNTFSF